MRSSKAEWSEGLYEFTPPTSESVMHDNMTGHYREPGQWPFWWPYRYGLLSQATERPAFYDQQKTLRGSIIIHEQLVACQHEYSSATHLSCHFSLEAHYREARRKVSHEHRNTSQTWLSPPGYAVRHSFRGHAMGSAIQIICPTRKA